MEQQRTVQGLPIGSSCGASVLEPIGYSVMHHQDTVHCDTSHCSCFLSLSSTLSAFTKVPLYADRKRVVQRNAWPARVKGRVWWHTHRSILLPVSLPHHLLRHLRSPSRQSSPVRHKKKSSNLDHPQYAFSSHATRTKERSAKKDREFSCAHLRPVQKNLGTTHVNNSSCEMIKWYYS